MTTLITGPIRFEMFVGDKEERSYAVINIQNGYGDTVFTVPYLRAEFVRELAEALKSLADDMGKPGSEEIPNRYRVSGQAGLQEEV